MQQFVQSISILSMHVYCIRCFLPVGHACMHGQRGQEVSKTLPVSSRSVLQALPSFTVVFHFFEAVFSSFSVNWCLSQLSSSHKLAGIWVKCMYALYSTIYYMWHTHARVTERCIGRIHPLPEYLQHHSAKFSRGFIFADFVGQQSYSRKLSPRKLFFARIICYYYNNNVQRLKAWLPVSSHSTNIVQRNALRGHSTKYKCFKNFVLYGITCFPVCPDIQELLNIRTCTIFSSIYFICLIYVIVRMQNSSQQKKKGGGGVFDKLTKHNDEQTKRKKYLDLYLSPTFTSDLLQYSSSSFTTGLMLTRKLAILQKVLYPKKIVQLYMWSI